MHIYTGCIGGLPANTVHCILTEARSRGKCVAVMEKSEVKALLGLAQSDHERELIRYSVFKSSGLTPTTARKQFGFERTQERSEHVQECIQEAQNIREAIIDKLTAVQDEALLASMGFSAMSASESETDLGTDSESSIVVSPSATTSPLTLSTLHEVLKMAAIIGL